MAVKTLGYYLDRLKLGLMDNVCAVCRMAMVSRTTEMVCPSCQRKIMLRHPVPLIALNNTPLYAACEFPHRMKQLIYGLKFDGKTRNGMTLAEILIHYWQALPLSQHKKWIVVPIPAHTWNKTPHLPLIARPFASHFGYDFIEDGLVWTRPVKAQHSFLSKRKRRENMDGALQLNPKRFHRVKPGTRILVIDDLITTGCTMVGAVSAFQQDKQILPVVGLVTSHVPLALSRMQLLESAAFNASRN